MGGFNPEKTYETFDIDSDKYELASFIAIGKPGNPLMLPENSRDYETKPRLRKKLYEFVNRIS
ncbi:MAG TPA: hypothetical protein DEQ09_07380 [Bacteroidales bacterium]|nr:hypothetical protein [Bacteroidales bacterium]